MPQYMAFGEGNKIREKTRRGNEEAGLMQCSGLWAVSTTPKLYPTSVHILLLILLSPWALGGANPDGVSLFGSEILSFNCSSLSLSISCNNPVDNLGNKVFLFLSSHSFPVTVPLLSSGQSCVSYITWYMPMDAY